MPSSRELTITWLGHATTLIEMEDGKRILIDPWLQGNPAVPEAKKNIDRLDLMLITHGHSDHMADAIPIAQQTEPDIIAIYEICTYLGIKGISKCNGMNKGGTVSWNDVKITLVDAVHSSFIQEGDQIIYAGTPGGFVLRFADGFTLYHTGDTDLFETFRLTGSLHHPDLVMMCIGDHYTMGPRQAAEALRMLGAKRVIPIHWGTFPVLTGTPEALRAEAADIAGLRVIALKPGDSVTQSEAMA
jgi:L-ascorbate metabolism protein UlaG (beta-lactamase superfamily)